MVSKLSPEGNTCEQATLLHHKPHFWDDALELNTRLTQIKQTESRSDGCILRKSHASSITYVVHSPHQTHTHTIRPVNEMRSVKSITVSSTAVENYFMSVCMFVCRHRRVWVYERESICMWVSECTHSHILTADDILLWQLAGNGHHRLTVYDNKQTCSRIPPLHLYLFNLCAYVCVGEFVSIPFLILWL